MPVATAERLPTTPIEIVSFSLRPFTSARLAPEDIPATHSAGEILKPPELPLLKEFGTDKRGVEHFGYKGWNIDILPSDRTLISRLLDQADLSIYDGFKGDQLAYHDLDSGWHDNAGQFLKEFWGDLHPLFHPEKLRFDPPTPILMEVNFGEHGQVDLLAEYPGLWRPIEIKRPGVARKDGKIDKSKRYAQGARERVPQGVHILISPQTVTYHVRNGRRILVVETVEDALIAT